MPSSRGGVPFPRRLLPTSEGATSRTKGEVKKSNNGAVVDDSTKGKGVTSSPRRRGRQRGRYPWSWEHQWQRRPQMRVPSA